jgi:hypothetical protein
MLTAEPTHAHARAQAIPAGAGHSGRARGAGRVPGVSAETSAAPPAQPYGTKARIRDGPPLPPSKRGAPTTTTAPLGGRRSRLARFSIP